MAELHHIQDSGLREAIEQYRQYAVDSSQRLLPMEKKHPWDGNAHSCQMWVRVWSSPEAEGRIRNFENAIDLFMRSRGSSTTRPENPHKRLIMLEGMEENLVNVIGADLHIPPAFFLAHCDEWTDLSVMDHAHPEQSTSRSWKVPIPQVRLLPPDFFADGVYGNYTLEIGDSGNFNRSTLQLTKESRSVHFRSFISFWGQQHEGKSWTAVIVTDSRKAQIRHQESDKVYELHNDGYDRQLLSEFSVNSPCERSPTWQISEPAHTQSCADLVRKMYGPDPQVSFNDPFSATIYVRRFVLSVWEEWMSQELADIHDGELADLRKHRGSNAFEHHEGEDSKIITDYQRMVDISHNIRLHKRAAKAIGWAFCNDAKDNKRSDGEEERRAWSILEEKLSLLEAQLGEWMGMFAQRASMAEALEANRQARSAGQLTKLATVAVPCSIVAAVFSMGGDFAAGKPLFPVFWVITLPVTFVLLLWVIHGNTIMAWWKARGKQKPQRKGREVQRAWNVLGWKLSLNVSAQPDEEKGK